jgi:hypothetical protein
VREQAGDMLHMVLEGGALLMTQPDRARAERGFDARLSGQLCYDVRQKAWTRFDIIAVGNHWGNSPNNEPARPQPAPLGVLFELAPANAPLVPPGAARSLAEYLAP